MTNVPMATIDAAGVSTPAESDILAGFWAVLQAAFGGQLNESLATPQGLLATALTAIAGAGNDLLLQYVNEVDPATSAGRMQDAIARIYFLSRLGALPTTVAVTLSGLAGTVIPAGSLASATDGTLYQSTGQITIGGGGTATGTFQATVNGAVACPAGSLTTIYRAVPGWDTITNPSDGVPGRDTESRAAFEARRQQSVAINALGILPSIRAALLNVPNVLDAYVDQNDTASTETIGGVSVPARTLFVSVEGGADADVARAIWRKKPPGCGYMGNTTVTIQDTSSGYQPPYPSYDVTFTRPSSVRIYAAVSIANSAAVPSDAATQIRNAMLSAFTGQDGGPAAQIGATLFASRFYSTVASLGVWARIISIKLDTTSTPASDEVAINIDQIATLAASDISVTVS